MTLTLHVNATLPPHYCTEHLPYFCCTTPINLCTLSKHECCYTIIHSGRDSERFLDNLSYSLRYFFDFIGGCNLIIPFVEAIIDQRQSAKAGFSSRTARRIDSGQHNPPTLPRQYATRKDPLNGLF